MLKALISLAVLLGLSLVGWAIWWDTQYECARTITVHHEAQAGGPAVRPSFGGSAGGVDPAGGINVGGGLAMGQRPARDAWDETRCVEWRRK